MVYYKHNFPNYQDISGDNTGFRHQVISRKADLVSKVHTGQKNTKDYSNSGII
jgi:hypothetical protein